MDIITDLNHLSIFDSDTPVADAGANEVKSAIHVYIVISSHQ